MKKIKLSLGLLGLVAVLGLACSNSSNPASGNNSGSATPTPSGPVTVQVLKNGTLLTWLGPYLESGEILAAGNGGGFTAKTDSITGDTTALELSGNSASCAGPCGAVYFVNAETQATGGSAVADDASAYFTNGHFQFDVELGNAASSYTGVTIFGESGSTVSPQTSSYNLTPSNYSTTAFTHVSIPISSIYTNGATSTLVYQCFSMGLAGVSGTVSIFIDDVKWTTN